jgi:hypothetical protein
MLELMLGFIANPGKKKNLRDWITDCGTVDSYYLSYCESL